MSYRRRRPGIIFVTAMWVILILGAMVLIFARSMRVEVTAAANRYSTEQASTVELGAEQYVLSAVDASNGDAVTVMATPAEQLPIYGTKNPDGNTTGNGYFWILQTTSDDDYDYAFGITDECSKLNLNVAADTQLASLPGITQDIADSIVDWRDTNETVTGQGAESSYYQSLPRPYMAKNAPFETVDELYLVKNMTDTIMYGYDLDHNGMIDNNELSAGGMATAFNSAQDTGRGIFPFVTVWGKEANTDANGKPRLNISNLSSTTALRNVLIKSMPAARVNQILARAQAIRVFRSVYDFGFKTGMKSSELAQVADKLTTSKAKVLPGLVNINTASQQVLMCLPGITQEDATSIAAQRGTGTSGTSGLSGLTGGLLGGGTPGTAGAGGANTTSATWIMDVLPPQKVATIGALITGKSYFFSADIVAVSGEGRAFKRVRIVVDARSSPPVIIYRKDLTYLGWPLSPDILTALKTNQPLPATTGFGTGGGNGLSQ